jgi:hypothetical protein
VRYPVPQNSLCLVGNKRMKHFLIIEKVEDTLFTYIEDEHHHNTIEKTRRKDSVRMTHDFLDNECNTELMPNDSYIVFSVQRENN